MLVATKPLSRQAYFCRDKRHVLLRQKTYFVATVIILVAAPANDTMLLFEVPIGSVFRLNCITDAKSSVCMILLFEVRRKPTKFLLWLKCVYCPRNQLTVVLINVCIVHKI